MSELESVESSATIYEQHALSVGRAFEAHQNDLPVSQQIALAGYHKYLRERAAKLRDLSTRLREQARRVAQERQAAYSCRICAGSIPENEDGLCFVCGRGER